MAYRKGTVEWAGHSPLTYCGSLCTLVAHSLNFTKSWDGPPWPNSLFYFAVFSVHVWLMSISDRYVLLWTIKTLQIVLLWLWLGLLNKYFDCVLLISYFGGYFAMAQDSKLLMSVHDNIWHFTVTDPQLHKKGHTIYKVTCKASTCTGTNLLVFLLIFGRFATPPFPYFIPPFICFIQSPFTTKFKSKSAMNVKPWKWNIYLNLIYSNYQTHFKAGRV